MLDFDANSWEVDAYESDRETDKVEGFADDATVLGISTEGAIASIKINLREFETISGLACNFDKSALMPVGYNNERIPDFLLNSGFEIAESLTILGLKFTKNSGDLGNNFEEKIIKVTSIRNFWVMVQIKPSRQTANRKNFYVISDRLFGGNGGTK
jgi:hypothetical protein